MIDYAKYQAIVKEMEELHPNDDYGMEKLWKNMISLLLVNIEDTIDLISDKCTPDEFSWTESIFSDIVEESQSPELLLAMHKTLAKYQNEPNIIEYNIADCMRFADGALNDEAWAEFEKLMKENGLG